MGAFDVYNHFIQMVVRGTILGQQWQISPCWVVTEAVAGVNIIDFPENHLANWFGVFWNGDGGLTDRGLLGALKNWLTEDCTVNEVRVFARSNAMPFPQQLVYSGNIIGDRGSSGQSQASFNAWSCYARADKFGQRGAAFRLPGVLDNDQNNNFFTSTQLAAFRAPDGVLDRLSNPLKYGQGSFYVAVVGELTEVTAMAPAVINRVRETNNGQINAASKPEFPYTEERQIAAYSCTQWQVHDFVSTQISRKVGRGR